MCTGARFHKVPPPLLRVSHRESVHPRLCWLLLWAKEGQKETKPSQTKLYWHFTAPALLWRHIDGWGLLLKFAGIWIFYEWHLRVHYWGVLSNSAVMVSWDLSLKKWFFFQLMHETTCHALGVFSLLVSSDVSLQDGLLQNTWRIHSTASFLY